MFRKILPICIVNGLLPKQLRYSQQIYNPFCTTTNSLMVKTNRKIFDEHEADRIRSNFNLHPGSDLKALNEKYQKYRNKLNLNEEIVFLTTFTEVITAGTTKYGNNNLSTVNNLTAKIINTLKNPQDEYPLIGSLLTVLYKLQKYDNKELWLIVGDYVVSDRMNASFNECLKALKSSKFIKEAGDEVYCNEYFEALENIIMNNYKHKTINVDDLRSVLDVYSSMDRTSFDFLEHLDQNYEKQLLDATADLEKLNMKDVNKFIEVGYYLAKLSMTNQHCIDYLQMIVGSKLADKNKEFKLDLFASRSLPQLIFLLGYARIASNIIINDDIKELIHEMITDQSLSYKLIHLKYMHQYIPDLSNNINEGHGGLLQVLEDKVYKVIATSVNVKDIKSYMLLRRNNEFDQEYGKFPTSILLHLDQLCAKNLQQSHPLEVYEFFEYIENFELRNSFVVFYSEFLGYFIINIRYFGFEEWCYVYYIYAREKSHKKNKALEENMETLRGYIYRTYTSAEMDFTGYASTVDINSNFYKILEVVDLNEFHLA